MIEDDFEFLSGHYPHWEEHYGPFWTKYREMADPRHGQLPVSLFPELPAMCRVCQTAVILPAPHLARPRYLRDAQGRRHALCSPACEHIFRTEPHRYPGKTWIELFDGWELGDYIERAGLVRADGKTLMAQPHVHHEERWLWTVDDIRRAGVELKDPLKSMRDDQFVDM